jgi:hypothetical protein
LIEDTNLTQEALATRLTELRRVKAVRLRQYVDSVVKELDDEIAGLKDGPASETSSGRERIARLMRERQNMMLYLSIMFQYQGPKPDARPDTPAGA